MTYLQGSCGKPQEAPVLLTQSCTTLLACLEELRNQIEQRHGGEFVKTVQACESAHKTSRVAEELLACAPSAPHAMMRLGDATLRAAAVNKAALENEEGQDDTDQRGEELASQSSLALAVWRCV